MRSNHEDARRLPLLDRPELSSSQMMDSVGSLDGVYHRVSILPALIISDTDYKRITESSLPTRIDYCQFDSSSTLLLTLILPSYKRDSKSTIRYLTFDLDTVHRVPRITQQHLGPPVIRQNSFSSSSSATASPHTATTTTTANISSSSIYDSQYRSKNSSTSSITSPGQVSGSTLKSLIGDDYVPSRQSPVPHQTNTNGDTSQSYAGFTDTVHSPGQKQLTTAEILSLSVVSTQTLVLDSRSASPVTPDPSYPQSVNLTALMASQGTKAPRTKKQRDNNRDLEEEDDWYSLDGQKVRDTSTQDNDKSDKEVDRSTTKKDQETDENKFSQAGVSLGTNTSILEQLHKKGDEKQDSDELEPTRDDKSENANGVESQKTPSAKISSKVESSGPISGPNGATDHEKSIPNGNDPSNHESVDGNEGKENFERSATESSLDASYAAVPTNTDNSSSSSSIISDSQSQHNQQQAKMQLNETDVLASGHVSPGGSSSSSSFSTHQTTPRDPYEGAEYMATEAALHTLPLDATSVALNRPTVSSKETLDTLVGFANGSILRFDPMQIAAAKEIEKNGKNSAKQTSSALNGSSSSVSSSTSSNSHSNTSSSASSTSGNSKKNDSHRQGASSSSSSVPPVTKQTYNHDTKMFEGAVRKLSWLTMNQFMACFADGFIYLFQTVGEDDPDFGRKGTDPRTSRLKRHRELHSRMHTLACPFAIPPPSNPVSQPSSSHASDNSASSKPSEANAKKSSSNPQKPPAKKPAPAPKRKKSTTIKDDMPIPEDGWVTDYMWLRVHKSGTKILNPVGIWSISPGTPVTDFSVSPDLSMMAATSKDGFLRVYSMSTYQLLVLFKSYFGGFTCFAWSPDSKYIVTGGEDDLLSVWSIENKQLAARGEGHSSFIGKIAFDAHRCSSGKYYRFASAGQDSKIAIWEFSADTLVLPTVSLQQRRKRVRSMSVSTGGSSARSTVTNISGINSPGSQNAILLQSVMEEDDMEDVGGSHSDPPTVIVPPTPKSQACKIEPIAIQRVTSSPCSEVLFIGPDLLFIGGWAGQCAFFLLDANGLHPLKGLAEQLDLQFDDLNSMDLQNAQNSASRSRSSELHAQEINSKLAAAAAASAASSSSSSTYY